VLVIVLVSKFLTGAWAAILAMRGIHRHYDRVSVVIAADETDLVLPSRVHAIVLVSKLHLPTMRALAYARATRPIRWRRSRSTSIPTTSRRSPANGRTGRSR
jgi:hypothetical protein